jgi:hypothetical protein
MSIKTGDKVVHSDCEILPRMASLLAWPLTVAVSSEYLPKPHKRWLLSRLKMVADSLGDAVLESMVENGEEFKF